MTDTPKPTPGWYPDPDMVDTVRYWDGNEWTEQRSPTKTSASQSPAIQDAKAQRSHKKAIIWTVTVVVILGALILGIALKKGMDNTVANGVALADAMTISDSEIADAGAAMNPSSGASASAPVNSENSSGGELGIETPDGFVDGGRCSLTIEQGGMGGLWLVQKSDIGYTKNDQWFLGRDCGFSEYMSSKSGMQRSGIWVQDQGTGDTYVYRDCGSDLNFCADLAGKNSVLLLKGSASNTKMSETFVSGTGGRVTLMPAPPGTERKSGGQQTSMSDLELAGDPTTSPKALRDLANSGNGPLACEVAQNPNASVDLLKYLAHKKFANEWGERSAYVARCVAKNPNAPADLLQELWKSKDANTSAAARKALDDIAAGS